MTQSEKRMFLIRELLAENPEYSSVPIPEDSENQKLLLRGLMNIRPPKNIHAEFLKVQDAYLREETEKKGNYGRRGSDSGAGRTLSLGGRYYHAAL